MELPLKYYFNIVKDMGFSKSFYLANMNRKLNGRDSSSFSIGFIEVSNYCDENCVGCYLGESKNDPETIQLDTAQKFIDETEPYGPLYFAIIGGEPFETISSDVTLGIVKNNEENMFGVCTNGRNMDEKLAEELGDCKNLIIALSIDGFEEKNDRRRGKGSFEAFNRTSRLLKKNKVPMSAYVTLNSWNYDEVSSPEFVDFLGSSGIKIANFQRHFPDNTGLRPNEENYVYTLKRLCDLSQNGSTVLATTFFGYLHNPSLQNRHKTIMVSKDGNISYGRNSLPMGNIDEESLDEIIKKFSEEERISELENGRDGNMKRIFERIMQ